MPPRAKEIRKNTLLIGKSLLICGVYFEMRRRKYTHILNFVYEDDIKNRNKYFPAISIGYYSISVQENHQQASPVS
jgi:hypothetical protein